MSKLVLRCYSGLNVRSEQKNPTRPNRIRVFATYEQVRLSVYSRFHPTLHPNEEVGNAEKRAGRHATATQAFECVGSPLRIPLEWARCRFVRTQDLHGCCLAEAVGETAGAVPAGIRNLERVGHPSFDGCPSSGRGAVSCALGIQMVGAGALARNVAPNKIGFRSAGGTRSN